MYYRAAYFVFFLPGVLYKKKKNNKKTLRVALWESCNALNCMTKLHNLREKMLVQKVVLRAEKGRSLATAHVALRVQKHFKSSPSETLGYNWPSSCASYS